MARPMLDDLELQQVQTIELDGDQVWTQHSIPALEGDFLQGLGRRAGRITLTGVLTGAEVADGLQKLRRKFRDAAPVSFVTDIATATRIDDVLIEEMGVRELAGKPARFEYAFTLREYTPATPTQKKTPPPPNGENGGDPEESVLEVEVIVEGRPDFDHSQTRVRVKGTDDEGNSTDRELSDRADNVWTADPFPPGRYEATATTTTPPMSGSASGELPLGQRRRITITLRPGQTIAAAFVIHYWFDKAFVEPCMRGVLRQVAGYAADHPEEKLVIVGHTDESGSAQYNQSLSERRARGAYAYLTFGRDQATAVAEWNEMRRRRPTGTTQTVHDTWGPRQYQQMLQELGFYNGRIHDAHDAATDEAVRAFQTAHGLAVDGILGDESWPVLIREYLKLDSLAAPEDQLMPNAKDGCDHGRVRWLGCSESMPLPSTKRDCDSPAWRPNRRTEFLFVRAESFPCDIPEPDTFDRPEPNSGGPGWCLGPGDPNSRCCFLTRDPDEQEKWLVQPAEPGTFVVNGRIIFEDGAPLANAEYVLIAPDGEFMNGEHVCGPTGTKGTPIPGRTDADGNLTDKDGNVGYADNAKGPGVYTLEIRADVVARRQGQPLSAAAGPVVCQRLEPASTGEPTEFNVTVVPAEEISDRGEIVVLVEDPEAEQPVPLKQAWVYWREAESLMRLRTNDTGALRALKPGADPAKAWEYTTQFTAPIGAQVDLFYSRGAAPIPDEVLNANREVFFSRTVDLLQSTNLQSLLNSVPGQVLLPLITIQVTTPAELSLWPVLWTIHEDAYYLDGLDQGAAMWRGGAPRPVPGNPALTENDPSPAAAAAVRPVERGVKVEGVVDAVATNVTILIRDASGNFVQLRPGFGAVGNVQQINATLGAPAGGTRPFEATILFADAVNTFGFVDIVVFASGAAGQIGIESITVFLCGFQLALVADQNAANRGPLLNEPDEKIVVDFDQSPQTGPAANISNETRARRMIVYEIEHGDRPLDSNNPQGPNNPLVSKPHMPLWMAEFHIVGLNNVQLSLLMIHRYFQQHGIAPGNQVTLNFDLEWELSLSWDGPDSNSAAFAQIPRHNQHHQFSQSFAPAAPQRIELHFGQLGQFLDAAGNFITPNAEGAVPGAIVPAPTAIPFPVAGRRLPQVVVSGQQRPWGRHTGAVQKDTVVIEFQPRIVNAANDEIIRGGNGRLDLTTVQVDGQRISPGLVPGPGGVPQSPPAGDPDIRLPRYRVIGQTPAQNDIEDLINAVVEAFFNAHPGIARITLLPLGVWQVTARLVILHESVGGEHFEDRGAGRRRIQFGGTLFRYGHEQGMPMFGAPHGYGLGQLDHIFNRGPNEDEVWSFLENIRSAVEVIMDSKATPAFNHLTGGAGGVAFNALGVRRRRAIYRREIVRRYNGGSEFQFQGGNWVVDTTSNRPQYPNNVLGTNVAYPGPTAFAAADFGPGI